MGEATHHVRQQWQANDDERLYGLGQHQQGLVDIKGTDLELRQYNGEIFIPLLVSSRGYGILWDNTSLSRFGRTEPPVWEEIPGTASGDASTGRGRSRRPRRATTSSAPTRRATSRSTPNMDGGLPACSWPLRRDREAAGHRSLAPGLAAGRGHRAPRPERRPEREAAVPLEGGHRRQDRPLRRQAAARRRRRRRRSGPRSATASTTGSSTGRRWIRVIAGYRRITGRRR